MGVHHHGLIKWKTTVPRPTRSSIIGTNIRLSSLPVKNHKIQKIKLNEKNISLKKDAKNIFDIINKKNYKFSKRVKDNNELYGSIKPKEISKNIENTEKLEIKPSQIDLGKEINKIGTYDVKINLHADVQATIHIVVAKEEEKN